MYKEIKTEHDRAERHNDHYSVVLFDVDHFKHYNDRNGHPAGDVLLRELGKIIKDSTRNTDFAARYDGEEFIILLRSTPSDGACLFAERLRTIIAAYPFAHGEFQPLGKVSVSLGVSSFPGNGKTFDKIIKSADQALYESKHAGRNRVTKKALE